MEKNEAYIQFDMASIISYQNDLLSTIEFIKDELPDVNWNSTVETIYHFSHEYNIMLHSTKIAELKVVLEQSEEDDYYEYAENIEDAKEVLTGLIELKKLQSSIRNHTQNIIKHADKNGYYPLRLVDGVWLQQNKRSISYDPNIQECVIEMHIPAAQ